MKLFVAMLTGGPLRLLTRADELPVWSKEIVSEREGRAIRVRRFRLR